MLYVDGDADWQLRSRARWSSSGHWKIVKGTHLSIVVVDPDQIAVARGEEVCQFYYHLIGVEEDRLTVRSPTPDSPDQTWARIAAGRRR